MVKIVKVQKCQEVLNPIELHRDCTAVKFLTNVVCHIFLLQKWKLILFVFIILISFTSVFFLANILIFIVTDLVVCYRNCYPPPISLYLKQQNSYILLGVSFSFQQYLARLNWFNIDEIIVKKLMYHLWYICKEGVKLKKDNFDYNCY